MRHIGAHSKSVLPVGRGREKALIVVAALEDGIGIERIRMRQIPGASSFFLQQAVAVDPVPYDLIVHPTRTERKPDPNILGLT
jgi:hypothetical protein